MKLLIKFLVSQVLVVTLFGCNNGGNGNSQNPVIPGGGVVVDGNNNNGNIPIETNTLNLLNTRWTYFDVYGTHYVSFSSNSLNHTLVCTNGYRVDLVAPASINTQYIDVLRFTTNNISGPRGECGISVSGRFSYYFANGYLILGGVQLRPTYQNN